MSDLPVIDVSAPPGDLAAALDAACRDTGFFYVVGHGIDDELPARVDALAREFFARPDSEKARIRMALGGPAWRGWFPVGGELTSGVPDRKEGIYFGAELGPDHPRVRAGVPLHGANLFPEHPSGLRDAVLDYLDALTGLGHRVTAGIGEALGLGAGWPAAHLTADPTILFRIFHYPPAPPGEGGWGVAEHTDYGLITFVRQDHVGGLQVHGRDGWIDAPAVAGSFVCNLGDMLERLTGGRYRSTPHRVRSDDTASRVSHAFFFDPSWDADVAPLPLGADAGGEPARWDGASVFDHEGTYGEYLLGKVAKVFPDLGRSVLDGPG